MAVRGDTTPSPCTSVCEFNHDRGICIGCFRTLDEIARWGMMSEERKREVLARLQLRRESSG